jgi:hypothetical protein
MRFFHYYYQISGFNINEMSSVTLHECKLCSRSHMREQSFVSVCRMSVFTATTTYNFVAGRRKLFQAGCACWIPGGAFCRAVSWLAGGENWGPVKGRPVSSFPWNQGPWEAPSSFFISVNLWPREGPSCFLFSVKTVAPRRAVLFLFLSAEQRAGDADDLWRRRLRCD